MRQKYVHKFRLSNLIVAELTTAKREDLLAKLQMHEFNLAEPFSPIIIRPTRARGQETLPLPFHPLPSRVPALRDSQRDGFWESPEV